ncbi:MAG: hypothetical protein ABI675_02675 [Chitinophagaceae bacterium]
MSKEALFKLDDDNFRFEVNGVSLTVKRLNLPGHVVFHVKFSSARKPITIARATNFDGEKFWTTISEGEDREAEARGVGKLIEDYLNKKR